MENNEKKVLEDMIEAVDSVESTKPLIDKDENVFEHGITFERAIEIAEKTIPNIDKTLDILKTVKIEKEKTEGPRTDVVHYARKKAESIKMGRPITVIYGDFDNQKVLNGRIVSIIEKGITVIDEDLSIKDPVVIQFDKMIDIFEVKKFRKEKENFTIFKMNKKIREFFTGDEEELKHAYEQKITVKKLRDELKKKNKEVK